MLAIVDGRAAPARPLADALRAYGLITGISVPAPEALQRLLSRTGLQAHFPAANAAIILCRSALTRPGSYRLALRLRIAASGSVATLKQAGSTGRPVRDAVISRSLRAQVFEPPPPAMPQPITILLRPDGAGGACQPAPAEDQADAR